MICLLFLSSLILTLGRNRAIIKYIDNIKTVFSGGLTNYYMFITSYWPNFDIKVEIEQL